MIKSTAYLSILTCLLLLFTAMTCNDSVVNNPEELSCIDRSKINPNQGCPRNYDPVCGCDGKTYNNECEAKKAGVTKWTKGKCAAQEATSCIDRSKVDKNKGCPRNYDPVCGCDDKTYTNTCEAEKAGVTNWYKGDCKSCQDLTKAKKRDCPDEYNPVCGCNGKTYSNACEAENAGLLKWEPGKCPKPCIDQSKIEPNKPCTKEFRPVCGCDGKTYSNKCIAEKAGVTSWTDGKCK